MLGKLACWGIAVGIGATGGYAYAANWPGSRIFGRTLIAGDDPGEIALTYDDGPNETYTPRLLEILARHDVRATFFLIGRHVRQRPALVRAIRAAGHIVGNHTMNHPVLLWKRPAQVREELASCNAAIEDALGEPVHYFRPPHGARRPDVLRTARELGLMPVMWNVTAGDWKEHSPERLVSRIERIRLGLAQRGRGANILLHDGGQHEARGVDRSPTLAATLQILQDWSAEVQAGRPLRLVTVDHWDKRSELSQAELRLS